MVGWKVFHDLSRPKFDNTIVLKKLTMIVRSNIYFLEVMRASLTLLNLKISIGGVWCPRFDQFIKS